MHLEAVVEFIRASVGPELRISVTFPDGTHLAVGHGPVEAAVRIRSWNALARLGTGVDQSVAFAEAYAAGELDLAGHGAALLGALYMDLDRRRLSPFRNISDASRQPEYTRDEQRENIHRVYDLPFEIYDQFLDANSRGYTSGWYGATEPHLDAHLSNSLGLTESAIDYESSVADWLQWSQDKRSSLLTDGQRAKIERVVTKVAGVVGMEPSGPKRILEVGCGWGAQAFALSNLPDVHVTALTLSERQADYVRAQASARNLTSVDVVVSNYRDYKCSTPFDVIVSVGMAEHVGEHGISEFARFLREMLRDDGFCVIHTMSGRRQAPANPFLTKFIFPGSYIHSGSSLVAAFEDAGFDLRDLEIWRTSYAFTLELWEANWRARKSEVLAGFELLKQAFPLEYPEAAEFYYRIWCFYFTSSRAAFLSGNVRVGQYVLAPAPSANFPDDFRERCAAVACAQRTSPSASPGE